MKKLVLFFVIGALAAYFVFTMAKPYLGDKAARAAGQRTGAVAVTTAAPVIGDINDEGRFTGTVQASAQFLAAPKISGRIKRVFVNIGDVIGNGSVIAKLDDEEHVLAVEEAKAALEIAKANFNESGELLEIAKKEYERLQTMRKQKVASDVEVENAQAAYKTRQAQHLVNKSLITQSETALTKAKLTLDYTNVDATWSDGSANRFIASRMQEEGAMITANTPIASVIDIATITVVINVVEQDYFKLSIGMHAKVTAYALPGKTFDAQIIRVAPVLDESTRQARIELSINNSEYLLKPGMFISATVIYDTHKNTCIIPGSAIVSRNESQGVFTISDNAETAAFVPIKTGFENGTLVEVVSPKIEGRVVVLGHHLLENGSRVKISDEESKNYNLTKNGAK